MVEINKFKKRILNLCEKYKVDEMLIDFSAIWDNSLTSEENFNVIIKKIKELASSKELENKREVEGKEKGRIKNEKQEQERLMLENLRKEEKNTEQIFKESLEKIKFETTEVLEKSFYVMGQLIKTLIKSKNISGLILRGDSGLGKSFTCLKVFNDMGFKKEKDFDILASYSTPLELYTFLYQNRDNKILLLDDIMKIFENELSIGILLSALWGEGERRVSYHTTSPKLEVPKSFIFNSKIIWCLNKLPKGLENIKSRCYFYTLEFDYKEKIMLLYEIAKIKNIPLKIVDWIYANSDEMTPLDFRLLLKVYDIQQNNKDWENIASALLNKNEKLAIAKKLIMSGALMKDILENWNKETGLSSRQLYRYREKIYKENRIN